MKEKCKIVNIKLNGLLAGCCCCIFKWWGWLNEGKDQNPKKSLGLKINPQKIPCWISNPFSERIVLYSQNYAAGTSGQGLPRIFRYSWIRKTSLLPLKSRVTPLGCELNCHYNNFLLCSKTYQGETDMKTYVGLHGPLAVNVDATMWHDYLGKFLS